MLIINKADKITSQQLMRVYGALMWSLGKVIATHRDASTSHSGKLPLSSADPTNPPFDLEAAEIRAYEKAKRIRRENPTASPNERLRMMFPD